MTVSIETTAVPPPWNRVGRHGVMPEATHDEIARFNFLANLNRYLATRVIPGVKIAYESRAEPQFCREHGRAPQTRPEIRRLMERDPFYQTWSALRRSTMEMRHQAGRAMVLRQLDKLIDKVRALNQGLDSLQLDATVAIPRYVSAVDIHCQPGCYYREWCEDDVTVAASYDAGLFVTTGGMLGAFTDGGGQAIAEWLARDHPGFAPKRILDIGCTVGHNVVPLAKAFPEAEVIAVDVAAPVLRYAHARARSLGVTNIRFVQANGEHLPQWADGSFDLITTSMFWHETSLKALPRIMGEVSRLLAPGGVTLHLEQPQYTAAMPLFEQFMRDWDTYNNNEPFWGLMHDIDMLQQMEDAGLPRAHFFEMAIRPSVDTRVFPPVDAHQGEDYGRTAAWNAFGAWKK